MSASRSTTEAGMRDIVDRPRRASPPPTSRGHAIVIGASMAGLLAARVLCDHFARVTLIERDSLPAQAESRKGVPQAATFTRCTRRENRFFADSFPGSATA